MKKTISVLLILALILSIMPSVFADGTFSVYLDIDFVANLMFSRYDVRVYIDETEVGFMPHGQYFTTLVENVSAGQHIISFYKSGDDKINTSKMFKVNGDTTVKCTIYAHSDSISCSSFEQISDIAGSSLEIPDLNLYYCNIAEKQLKNIGFININYKSDTGSSISGGSKWIVTGQNPIPGEKVDKNNQVTLICTSAEAFYKDNFGGLNVEEARQTAEELGYKLRFLNTIQSRNITNYLEGVGQEALHEWIVAKGETNSVSDRLVDLYLTYTGNVEVPNLIGTRLDNAYSSLEESNFSNIRERGKSGSSIWARSNWIVVEQSIPAGSVVLATDQITLLCVKEKEYTKPDTENASASQDSTPATELAPDATPEATPVATPKPTPEPVENTDKAPEEISTENEGMPGWHLRGTEEEDAETVKLNYDAMLAFKLSGTGIYYIFDTANYIALKYDNDTQKLLTGNYTEDGFSISIKYEQGSLTEEGRWTSSGDKSSVIVTDNRLRKVELDETLALIPDMESLLADGITASVAAIDTSLFAKDVDLKSNDIRAYVIKLDDYSLYYIFDNVHFLVKRFATNSNTIKTGSYSETDGYNVSIRYTDNSIETGHWDPDYNIEYFFSSDLTESQFIGRTYLNEAFHELSKYEEINSEKIKELIAPSAETANNSATTLGYHIGDIITFGKYEQDNNNSNGKERIDWIILDIKDNNLLLISKYALDSKQYNASKGDTTWANSSLRKWLNNEFINTAFKDSEKSQIQTITVKNSNDEFKPVFKNKKQIFKASQPNTLDKVFLLSYKEGKKYFEDNKLAKCYATAYAKAQGVSYVIGSQWWLRTPGEFNSQASYYDTDGFSWQSMSVDHEGFAIRPSIWIPVNNEYIEKTNKTVYDGLEYDGSIEAGVIQVWISDSGNKYHTSPICSNMKNAYKVSLTEAQARGYEACEKCR